MMSAIAVNELLQIPETLEKLVFPSSSASSRAHHESAGHQDTKGLSSVAVDILESPRDYTFYIDVPGLSKSDIQVTVEDEKTLVIRSNVKRKREEDAEEDGVKYIRWERKRTPFKFLRFSLEDIEKRLLSFLHKKSGVKVVIARLLRSLGPLESQESHSDQIQMVSVTDVYSKVQKSVKDWMSIKDADSQEEREDDLTGSSDPKECGQGY